MPSLFIDVQEQCLTERSTSETKYTALSYVWGKTTFTLTKMENLELLKQAHSLSATAPGIIIPNTVRHAMLLTASLGLKYLWVDCLCIVQDDLENIGRWLSAMTSIYANAYLTVIAADSEGAEQGIRGISPDTETRMIPLHTFRFPENPLQLRAFPESTADREISRTKWAERAWTFQEGFFSNRVLIFNGTMSWMCNGCYAEEGDSYHSDDSQYFISLKSHAMKYICQIRQINMGWTHYISTVPVFNMRSLTYDSDVMKAFAGVTDYYSSGMFVVNQKGFLYGHPLEFFEVSLLWQTESDAITRKRSPRGPSENMDRIPSWSWFGWQGPLDLTSWERYTMSSAPTPQVSIKKKCIKCGQQVVVRSMCCYTSDKPSLVWSISFEYFSSELIFKASMAEFYIVHVKEYKYSAIGHPNGEGDVIGQLVFNGGESWDFLQTDIEADVINEDQFCSSEPYQFILIAESRDRLDEHCEWELSEEYEGDECCYALCVRWDGDVAVRIGLAVISRTAWTEWDPEEVDVILR